jgi:hypothetical protein
MCANDHMHGERAELQAAPTHLPVRPNIRLNNFEEDALSLCTRALLADPHQLRSRDQPRCDCRKR